MQEQFWSRSAVRHNIFFSARPDVPTGVHMASFGDQIASRFGLIGKPLPPERLHVSLLNLGYFEDQLPLAVLKEAEDAASAVSIAPFQVVFDRVESFGGGQGKRALVLTGRDGTAGFLQLQQELQLAMFKAGIKVESQKGFKPHLTLMYADQVPEMPVEPVSWIVNGFALIDSSVGRSRHRLLGQWQTTIH